MLSFKKGLGNEKTGTTSFDMSQYESNNNNKKETTQNLLLKVKLKYKRSFLSTLEPIFL